MQVLSRPLRGRETMFLPHLPARPQSHIFFEAGVRKLPANPLAPQPPGHAQAGLAEGVGLPFMHVARRESGGSSVRATSLHILMTL